jgi:hypothetical protein
MEETETSITGKLARGTFAVSFFLACLAVLEILPQRARCAAHGVLDRVLDALLRGACDLDDPVNVIRHRYLLWRDPATQGSVRLLENTCALTFVPLRPI